MASWIEYYFAHTGTETSIAFAITCLILLYGLSIRPNRKNDIYLSYKENIAGYKLPTIFFLLTLALIMFPTSFSDIVSIDAFICASAFLITLVTFFEVRRYYLKRHIIRDGVLDCFRNFNSRKQLKIMEISKVDYSEDSHFTLRTGDGQEVFIDTSMTGLFAFAHAILKHVPASAIDQRTGDILEQVASGKLHSN